MEFVPAEEEPSKNQTSDTLMCTFPIFKRFHEVVKIMSRSSIYGNDERSINELTSGQCLLLILLYALTVCNMSLIQVKISLILVI